MARKSFQTSTFHIDMDRYLDDRKRYDPDYSQHAVSKHIETDDDYDDDYSERKGMFSKLSALFNSRNASIAEDEYAEADEAKSSFEDQIEEIERRQKQLLEEEQELTQKKSSAIWNFITKFNIFRSSQQMEDEDSEEYLGEDEKSMDSLIKHAEVLSDLKEVGKICVQTMNRLHPREQRSFKGSEEFKQFREIMQKHNLIK